MLPGGYLTSQLHFTLVCVLTTLQPLYDTFGFIANRERILKKWKNLGEDYGRGEDIWRNEDSGWVILHVNIGKKSHL